METTESRQQPGRVRDAILSFLGATASGASVSEIQTAVTAKLHRASASSVRSYLRLNTPDLFERTERGQYRLRPAQLSLPVAIEPEPSFKSTTIGRASLVCGDCMPWLHTVKPRSIHAVVTDPPYGLIEYSDTEQAKLRSGKGGVWRLPPSFDGHKRSPLPRFTVLTAQDLANIETFFREWAIALLPALVPGAHVVVASNPLVSHIVATALSSAGLEKRGEIIRLIMTMRGGDRPKNAHQEFADVSVMPRSMWEPWLLFRAPIEGRVQDNLRQWRVGGLRRPQRDSPFGDVIKCGPASKQERQIAPHPTLKPQKFLRQIVRAVLPFGEGVVLDTFAGSGSTLAAAEAIGYQSMGVERAPQFFTMATRSIKQLSALEI